VRGDGTVVQYQAALATAPRHPTCRAFLAEHLDLLIKAAKALGRAEEAAEAQRTLQELKAGEQGAAGLDARLSALLKAGAPKKGDRRERPSCCLTPGSCRRLAA
jgi:hypothetical protein